MKVLFSSFTITVLFFTCVVGVVFGHRNKRTLGSKVERDIIYPPLGGGENHAPKNSPIIKGKDEPYEFQDICPADNNSSGKSGSFKIRVHVDMDREFVEYWNANPFMGDVENGKYAMNASQMVTHVFDTVKTEWRKQLGIELIYQLHESGNDYPGTSEDDSVGEDNIRDYWWFNPSQEVIDLGEYGHVAVITNTDSGKYWGWTRSGICRDVERYSFYSLHYYDNLKDPSDIYWCENRNSEPEKYRECALSCYQNLAMHEIGHAMGADHWDDLGGPMDNYSCGLTFSEPALRQIWDRMSVFQDMSDEAGGCYCGDCSDDDKNRDGCPLDSEPTAMPTVSPTRLPTRLPTPVPTQNPTSSPTMIPTKKEPDYSACVDHLSAYSGNFNKKELKSCKKQGLCKDIALKVQCKKACKLYIKSKKDHDADTSCKKAGWYD